MHLNCIYSNLVSNIYTQLSLSFFYEYLINLLSTRFMKSFVFGWERFGWEVWQFRNVGYENISLKKVIEKVVDTVSSENPIWQRSAMDIFRS